MGNFGDALLMDTVNSAEWGERAMRRGCWEPPALAKKKRPSLCEAGALLPVNRCLPQIWAIGRTRDGIPTSRMALVALATPTHVAPGRDHMSQNLDKVSQ